MLDPEDVEFYTDFLDIPVPKLGIDPWYEAYTEFAQLVDTQLLVQSQVATALGGRVTTLEQQPAALPLVAQDAPDPVAGTATNAELAAAFNALRTALVNAGLLTASAALSLTPTSRPAGTTYSRTGRQTQITDTDAQAAYSGELGLFQVDNADRTFVAMGDSITEGFDDPALDSWFVKMIRLLPVACDYLNTGVDSGRLHHTTDPELDLRTIYTNRIRPIILDRAATINLWLWAGTNDIYLGGSDGAQAYSDLVFLIDQMLTDGLSGSQIWVPTMLPRQGDTPERGIYNQAIRDDAGGRGYLVIDHAARAPWDDPAVVNNPNFVDSDKVHPVRNGHNDLEAFCRQRYTEEKL